MFALNKIKKGIYLLTFKDHIDLVSHFFRFQEIYESPHDNICNKPFELLDFIRTYTKNNPDDFSFTYYDDWVGFNQPVDIILKYYPILKDPNTHDHFMYNIAKYISRDNSSEPAYLIGTLSGKNKTINHEIAHALYYTNKEYHTKMHLFISKYNKSNMKNFNVFKEALLDLGYRDDDNIIYDEMQAYLATGFSDVFDVVPPKDLVQKIKNVFEEYTLDIDFESIS